jgi:anti-anti-sigma regulatory factor
MRRSSTAFDQAGSGPCILDLTAMTFLDSAGLTTLLDATLHADSEKFCATWSKRTALIRPIRSPVPTRC